MAEGGVVAEGKAVWKDFEGAGDEKPFSGKELLYNDQILPSPNTKDKLLTL